MSMFDNQFEEDHGEGEQARREADALNKVHSIKFMRVRGKCDDRSQVIATNSDGGILFNIDGYMPSGLGFGRSDYIEFVIDIETGQIMNWKKPSEQALIDSFLTDKEA